MPSRASVALLVLAVALAGCGGFVGVPSPPDADADPTTDDTTTASRPPAQVVPGVTEDGVTDPLALADAHAAVLHNHSYTANETRTLRLPNGTVVNRVTRFSTVNGSRALFAVQWSDTYGNAPFRSVTQWENDSASVGQFVGPNGSVTYRRSPQLDGLHSTPADWSGELYGYLGAGSFAVADSVVRGGEVLYRLESTESFRVASGGNASMWLLVDDRGFVHEYHLTADARWEGEPITRTADVRFTDVGATTVERPSWVDEARNETRNETG